MSIVSDAVPLTLPSKSRVEAGLCAPTCSLPWGDLDGTIDGKQYYRYDHEELDPKEQWTNFCETQDALREIGYELDDPQLEHDFLSGILVRVQANTKLDDCRDND